MGIELFLNDYYDLLKLMHDNEVIILDEKALSGISRKMLMKL